MSSVVAPRGMPDTNVQLGRRSVFPRDVYLEAHAASKGAGPYMRLADFNEQTLGSAQPPPKIMYALVEFKMYRTEVYQMRMDWAGWEPGDILTVIVDADRLVTAPCVHKLMLIVCNIVATILDKFWR